MARLLWRLWSPNWQFAEATFDATASSFDNPDFLSVSIQSYRHRYGNSAGDPVHEGLERRLMSQPAIGVGTIVLHGACDGVVPPTASEDAHQHFAAFYERHVIQGSGPFPLARNPRRSGTSDLCTRAPNKKARGDRSKRAMIRTAPSLSWFCTLRSRCSTSTSVAAAFGGGVNGSMQHCAHANRAPVKGCAIRNPNQQVTAFAGS